MIGTIQLRVGGEWLVTDRHAWGDLTFSSSWPGGCKEASWSASTTYEARHPALVRGALVEVMYGGYRLWAGDLQEPVWEGGEARFTAAGLCRRGERYVAFDSSLNTTDRADTAIDEANGRGTGLDWTRATSIPTTSLGAGTTDAVNTVTALLDAHAEKLGQRWAVGADGVVYMAADPTTPAYFLTPGAADLGVGDDNYASHVILRHRTTTGTPYRSAIYPSLAAAPTAYELKYGHSEFTRDITDLGPMSNADADSLAQKVYEQSKARPGWTNGLEVTANELLTAGGAPADLAIVAAEGAGKLLRLNGVPDEVALTPYTDVVIGEASWQVGSETVNLSPVGLVSRSQEDVLVEILEGRAA